MSRNPEAKPEHNFKVGQVMVVIADTSGHGLRLNTGLVTARCSWLSLRNQRTRPERLPGETLIPIIG